MKVDPLSLILNDKYLLNKQFYFISGNELTLMQKIKDLIINKLKLIENLSVEKIKNISLIKNDIGLFNECKLYIITDLSGIDNEKMEDLSASNDKFIFYGENSPKNKSLKNVFIKSKNCELFECYELTKDSKSKIIKKYIDSIGLEIEDSLYWSLVDNLDNKYQLLENELNKFLELPKKNINKKLIETTITKNNEGIEKIFFNVMKSNAFLIDYYNKKITNNEDVNKMYFYFKQLCFLIFNSNDLKDFEKNIPPYLFREKNYLISLFKKFNNKKKKDVLNLFYNTEKNIRSNGGLSQIIGMRFLFKFKKISIS